MGDRLYLLTQNPVCAYDTERPIIRPTPIISKNCCEIVLKLAILRIIHKLTNFDIHEYYESN